MKKSKCFVITCLVTGGKSDGYEEGDEQQGLPITGSAQHFPVGLLSSSAPELQGEWREVKRKIRTQKKVEKDKVRLVFN